MSRSPYGSLCSGVRRAIIQLMRAWLSERLRRSAVVKRSVTTDPPEVAHALDFFIWSALDDAFFEPQEPRPFGDDERHYNAILNSYYEIDQPSTAQHTLGRVAPFEPRPEGAFFVPQYFPDEDRLATLIALTKHSYVIARFARRHDTLKDVRHVRTWLEPAPPSIVRRVCQAVTCSSILTRTPDTSTGCEIMAAFQ